MGWKVRLAHVTGMAAALGLAWTVGCAAQGPAAQARTVARVQMTGYEAHARLRCPAHLTKAVWHPMGGGTAWSFAPDQLRRYEARRGHRLGRCGRIVAFPRQSYVLTGRGVIADES